MTPGIEDVVLADAEAWRAWLDANEETSDGIWLRLAKKGTTAPTSLGYADALEEALCSGWIDGQKRACDDATFVQRFTPRRRASLWSRRNIDIALRLVTEGRMRPRGQYEIDRARADGRWERAYAGAATIQPPQEFLSAFESDPLLGRAFADATSARRFSLIHGVVTAATPATRERRVARALGQLRTDVFDAFWQRAHQALDGLPSECPAAWSFGATPQQADALLALVLAGTKTATASALWDYEASGDPLPSPGDLSVVLDGRGVPVAVIRTTAVDIVPFDAVGDAHAAAEGEGDRTLRSWRAEHEAFWRAHAAHEREFAHDMPVVCERFELLLPRG